ncbi:disease resistance-like protein DSC1 [Corylus avellana]|uniref:disease resistance-like protein DSC1 n=1 Tax=Corylus avellana TaxID=13451 RepID=UPI00286D36D2|nr:disease resistance-like protein DSC1 [Corylus avellana]
MGREIVPKEYPKEPGKYSRLWLHEDAFDILTNHKGTKVIEGLTSKILSSSKVFKKMEILNLSHSYYLIQTPDFSSLPNLEKLILKDCTSLFKIDQSIGDLSNLVLVNLKDCIYLQTLPRSFYKLTSLKILILSGCSKIDDLANDLGEMESLATLRADNTAITQVPFTIVKLKNLKHLSLCGCKGSPSETLPSLFCSQIPSINLLSARLQGLNSLTELCLRECNLPDGAIPSDIGSLCSLQSLDLGGNSFSSLPPSVGGLSRLSTFKLTCCKRLQSIPDLPVGLIFLVVTNCMALESMPDLSKFENMTSLSLINCHNLVEIPGLVKLSNPVVSVHMEGCRNLSTTFKQTFLQEWSMRGIGRFGIFLLGNDIPDWFTFKDEGSSVSFECAHSVEWNFKGFATCIVYSSSVLVLSTYSTRISIINHTKNTIQTITPTTIGGPTPPGDHLWLCNVHKSRVDFEGGDKVTVGVDFGPEIVVKKTGVCLAYDRAVEGKMMDYASTSSEDATHVVSDDKDATKDNVGMVPTRVIRDDKFKPKHELLILQMDLFNLVNNMDETYMQQLSEDFRI